MIHRQHYLGSTHINLINLINLLNSFSYLHLATIDHQISSILLSLLRLFQPPETFMFVGVQVSMVLGYTEILTGTVCGLLRTISSTLLLAQTQQLWQRCYPELLGNYFLVGEQIFFRTSTTSSAYHNTIKVTNNIKRYFLSFTYVTFCTFFL